MVDAGQLEPPCRLPKPRTDLPGENARVEGGRWVRALRERGLLVVRHGSSDPVEKLRSVGREFGRAERHPSLPATEADEYVSVLDSGGGKGHLAREWHYDAIRGRAPSLVTMLAITAVPDSGASTCFVRTSTLYADLPSRLQRVARRVRYSPYSPNADASDSQRPRAVGPVLPLVWRHPVTGQGALQFLPSGSRFVTHLAEQEELRMAIVERLNDASRWTRVPWEPGVVLLWDNRDYLHRAGEGQRAPAQALRMTIEGPPIVGL